MADLRRPWIAHDSGPSASASHERHGVRDGLRVGRESMTRRAKRSEAARIAASGVAAVELGSGEDEAALPVDTAEIGIDLKTMRRGTSQQPTLWA
jgi:hypothetical protein